MPYIYPDGTVRRPPLLPKPPTEATKAANPHDDPAALRSAAAILREQGDGPLLAQQLEARAHRLERPQPAPTEPSSRAEMLAEAARLRQQAALHSDPVLERTILNQAGHLEARASVTAGKAAEPDTTAPVGDVDAAELHRQAQKLEDAADILRGLDDEAEARLRKRAEDLRRQAVEHGPK